MSGLDLVIAVFVVLGMWRGFSAGLIQSIVSLVGWLVAFVLGSKFADVMAPNFVNVVDSEVLQLGLGFLSIVLIVIAILHICAFILRQMLSTLKISFLDKIAGGVLGAARNILVVLVILSTAAPVFARLPIWQNSVFVPELLPYAPVAKVLMKETFGDAWQQLDRKTDLLEKKTREHL